MAHREPSRAQVVLDQRRELEQPQAVGDAAPVASDSLRKLLLRPPELGKQALIGLGLLHRVQVFTQEVLDQCHLEALGIGGVPDDRGNRRQARELCGAPTPLTDDELIALAQPPNHDGLKDSGLTQGRR